MINTAESCTNDTQAVSGGNLVVQSGGTLDLTGTTTITVDGNVIVQSGGTLNLRNTSTITFTGAARQIQVEQGGQLTIDDTAGFNQ